MKLLNQHALIEFDEIGRILRLEEPKSGRNYLAAGSCELFRLTLVETFEGAVLPGELRLTPETAEKVELEQVGETLQITFLRLDGLEIDVVATVSLKDKEAFWGLKVLNRTAFAVRQVEYPWFQFRTPLGDAPETERILLPKMDGILLGNPSIYPWQKNVDGVQEERYWYPGEGKQHPLNLAVQLVAYYDEEGGILLYTADTDGHPKRFGPILRDEDRIDLSPVHLRPELGGLDFSLEYPVVTRFFKGDWQDAALAYREWAKTAPWCEKTVAQREEIPRWIKEGAFFFNFRLRYQKGGEEFLDRVPAYVRSWQEKLNLPMVAMMCGWEKIGEWAGPDYFPPYGGDERFKKMCDQLIRDGNRPFTFGLSGIKLLVRRHQPKAGPQPHLAIDYDARKKFREEWVHSAALDPNGVPYMDSNLDEWDGVHAYACPATAQAMDQLCGASLKMLRDYGVTVQQADQVLGGGTPCCYSKEHGHPPGWGNWQVKAVQKIYDETRSRCKALNPDFALSEEWISEPFIQHLDLYHARNYDKPQGGLEAVPLFSFLYHEYIPCYGGDWTPFLPSNKTGVHFHGWNFVCGNLPAGSPLVMLKEFENHPLEDADPKIMEMAVHACAAFRKNTRFLVEGKILPSSQLSVPKLRMMIDGLDFGCPRREIEIPVVLHMFWEAPDGKRACALANISDEIQNVSLPVDLYAAGVSTLSVERNGEVFEDLRVENGKAVICLKPRDAVMVLL